MVDQTASPYQPPLTPGYTPLDPYQTNLPQVNPVQTGQTPVMDIMGDPQALPTNTTMGGVSGVNPQAGAMDYGQLNQFSDAAYQQSQRYLQPQIEQQNEQFNQSMINKGIDPNSQAGQRALEQKNLGQNDLQSKAAFDAMGFGAGMQNQMFGQDAQRSGLANALVQKQWDLGGQNYQTYMNQLGNQAQLAQGGHQFDTNAALGADQQAYSQMMGLEGMNYRNYDNYVQQLMAGAGMDQQGAMFDTSAMMKNNQMNYDQMMGMENLNYRDYLTYTDESRYQDTLAMALAGLAPAPGYNTTNTSLSSMPAIQYTGDYQQYYS